MRLQEIAAKSLGGKPADYEVGDERVFRKGGGAGMTLAQAAQKAIQLGGIYDGHEVNPDVNKYTKQAANALAGQGLVVSARDKYPHDGQTFSYVASFAEVEVDLETGKYHLVDFLAYADVGSVLHPKALGGQVMGRSILGIGHAIGQKWVMDPQYGAMLSTPVPLQQTAHDPRYPRQDGLGSAGHSGSGDAGGIARYRRTSGGWRLRGYIERSLGRCRRRGFPPSPGECRYDSRLARCRPAHAASAHGAHLKAVPAAPEVLA